ncbi:hypothetical protein BA065_02390 [Nanoarchaeota archaeon NZ13-N]|nr:MAG: hypothetical protein BA065_02390 [Nanoarchaeota archaeon NZ13-N]
MILVTHWDIDGIFCLYLFYKRFGDRFKVYFSGPRSINRVLSKLIYEGKNNEELFITDIATNQVSLYLSACFNGAHWIDHHEIDSFDVPKGVEIFIKRYKSAARCVADYFNLEDNYLDIADDIDSNNIRSDLERDLRDLVTAIRYFNPKTYPIYFENIAKELNSGIPIENIIEKRKKILKDYREYLKKKEDYIILSTKIFNLSGRKVFIVEMEYDIPSYNIIEILQKRLGGNIDYIVILYGNRGEIRTTTEKNVLGIAKCLGGGGHRYAAGFQYDNKDLIVEKIKECIEKVIKNEEKLIG